MKTDFALCLARPIVSVAFVIALSGVLPIARCRSAHAQPPASKYDADMLADRSAAIAAVLKAGGKFEAAADVFIEPSAQEYMPGLLLIEATKTDILLPKLSSLSELQNVNLTASDVTDAGLKHLAALGKLQSLNLAQTSISDAGLKHLARLENLEWLDLTRTSIDDAGLERLKPLTKLRHLGLRGTRITAAGLKALQALPQLVSIDVADTAITPIDLLLHLPQTSRRAAAIGAQLMGKTDLDCKDVALSDVVEFLKERHDIEIQMDIKSFEEEGISTETPITCQLRGVPLREALATILDPLDLGFVVRHEILLIAAEPIGEAFNLPEVAPGERLSPVLALALLRPSPLAFDDQPLSKVVEYLKVTHGIEIEIDQKSLVEVGVGLDTPVTRNVKNVSLRSALELLLSDFDLTCVATGDKLIIRAREHR